MVENNAMPNEAKLVDKIARIIDAKSFDRNVERGEDEFLYQVRLEDHIKRQQVAIMKAYEILALVGSSLATGD